MQNHRATPHPTTCRRRRPRFEAYAKGWLRRDGTGTFRQGEVVDVSESGARVSLGSRRDAPRPGEVVDLTVRLDSGQYLFLKAVCSWAAAGFVGLRFDRTFAKAKDLSRWLRLGLLPAV